MVLLRPLDRFTWEEAARIEPQPHQAHFLPSVLQSLAQSKFENLFPLGIYNGDQMVGFAMYGEFSGTCWITRVLVDHRLQGKGYGKAAIRAMIALLHGNPKCRELRTSVARDNFLALKIFESLGFRPISEALEEEVVMRFEG